MVASTNTTTNLDKLVVVPKKGMALYFTHCFYVCMYNVDGVLSLHLRLTPSIRCNYYLSSTLAKGHVPVTE